MAKWDFTPRNETTSTYLVWGEADESYRPQHDVAHKARKPSKNRPTRKLHFMKIQPSLTSDSQPTHHEIKYPEIIQWCLYMVSRISLCYKKLNNQTYHGQRSWVWRWMRSSQNYKMWLDALKQAAVDEDVHVNQLQPTTKQSVLSKLSKTFCTDML